MEPWMHVVHSSMVLWSKSLIERYPVGAVLGGGGVDVEVDVLCSLGVD